MRRLDHNAIPRSGWLTPREVAALFYVDPKTASRWAIAGRVPAIKTPGGHWRFSAEEMWALLEGES